MTATTGRAPPSSARSVTRTPIGASWCSATPTRGRSRRRSRRSARSSATASTSLSTAAAPPAAPSRSTGPPAGPGTAARTSRTGPRRPSPSWTPTWWSCPPRPASSRPGDRGHPRRRQDRALPGPAPGRLADALRGPRRRGAARSTSSATPQAAPGDGRLPQLTATRTWATARSSPAAGTAGGRRRRSRRRASTGAGVVDALKWFCADGVCPSVVGSYITMRDSEHMTPHYARWLAKPLQTALGLKGPTQSGLIHGARPQVPVPIPGRPHCWPSWSSPALVFVLAPGLPLLGTDSSGPASGPTPVPVVPSDGNTQAPDAQETVGPTGPLDPEVPGASGPEAGRRRQTTCVPQGSDVSLSVLSFNIHSARGRTAAWTWSRSPREIEALGPRRRAAPGGRPEPRLHQPHRPAGLLRAAARHGGRVRGEQCRQGGGEYGVATLSKYPIVEPVEHATCPHDPSSPRDQQRGVLNTQDPGRATPSSASTTPTCSTSSTACACGRCRRSRGILRADPLPKILGGDLNSGPARPRSPIARSILRTRGTPWASAPACTVPQGAGSTSSCTPTRWSPRPRRCHLVADLRPPRRSPAPSRSAARANHICVPVFDEPLE